MNNPIGWNGIDPVTLEPKGLAQQLLGDNQFTRFVDELVLVVSHASPALYPIAIGVVFGAFGIDPKAATGTFMIPAAALATAEGARNKVLRDANIRSGDALVREIISIAQEHGVKLDSGQIERLERAAPQLSEAMKSSAAHYQQAGLIAEAKSSAHTIEK